MYNMKEIYMTVAHMHRNAHEKAMKNDFQLGVQMACEKFLTMLSQTKEFAGHPYVEEVTQRITEGQQAVPSDDRLHIYINGKWRDCRGIEQIINL